MKKAAESPFARQIEAHLTKHVAPVRTVFHEIVSEIVHIDVHVVAPSRRDPFWLLYTTGMSALPMTMHPRAESSPHAELCVLLPAWWQVFDRDPRWHWPVRELISSARFPHRRKTWLGCGHTIASHAFHPSTELCATLISHSTVLPAEAQHVPTGDKGVDLFTLWFLRSDELRFKMKRGAPALLERFAEANVDEVVSPLRSTVLARSVA